LYVCVILLNWMLASLQHKSCSYPSQIPENMTTLYFITNSHSQPSKMILQLNFSTKICYNEKKEDP
jgi:hypothetical protein